MLAAETANTTAKPSMIFERNRRVGSLSDRGQIRFDIATLNPRLLSESQSNREYGLRHLVPKTRAEWIKGRKYAPNPRAGAYAARAFGASGGVNGCQLAVSCSFGSVSACSFSSVMPGIISITTSPCRVTSITARLV